MELAFREPIKNVHGDVKYPAGVFFEWPKATFQRIADNVGKPLDKITVTKEEAGAAIVGGSSSTSLKRDTKDAPGRSRKRSRLTKRARMQE